MPAGPARRPRPPAPPAPPAGPARRPRLHGGRGTGCPVMGGSRLPWAALAWGGSALGFGPDAHPSVGAATVGADESSGGIPRRRFLGYLIAAPTVAAAARFGIDSIRQPAEALIPSLPQPADLYDLT